MKKLLLLTALMAPAAMAYEHNHSSIADLWAEDSLERWQPADAFIPITVSHGGPDTDYYIEVNNEPVTNVFTMTDNDTLSVDVPVKLEARKGAQLFKVCSVSLAGSTGMRICSEAELFNLYPSE
ncbi:hypothetical protein [Vibrio maritimus]|uniref:hypothetical protein n=1 Tax=Vibrio maritimus TaxID=990268 RepID=UPI001F3A59F2|nr:hypothetical protein [Vibrio maritimus]